MKKLVFTIFVLMMSLTMFGQVFESNFETWTDGSYP